MKHLTNKSQRKNKNMIVKVASYVIAMTAVTYVFGFGCGPAFKPHFTSEGSSSSSSNGGGAIIPATKTAGVPILSQSYASLVSALQLATPSNASRTEFQRQSVYLSENGHTSTVGASMMLAYTTLAAQVCLDRVNAETPANSQKLFFNAVNLGAGPNNNVTEANLGDAINRLARALWQRDETLAERAILVQAVNDSMALDNQNNANKSQEAALFLCTAMAASSSGVQL